MLASYISDNHRLWGVNLAKVACAMRTASHDSTGHTPFFINFGRRMILDGNEYKVKIEDEDQDADREVGFKKLFEDVRRLDMATKKHEKTYNLRRRDEFLPNQLVWRRNFVLLDAAKYFTKKPAPKYIVPFSIKKRLSPWTYELVDSKGNSAGTWNAKDLKPASADENLP